jgi:transcriptional regulator with XRE-family HTH domain
MNFKTEKKGQGQTMQRLGEKIRTLRIQRGMSVRQLASALGVNSHSHIVAIESGKSRPSVELLVKMMRLFDVSCDQLLDDDLELD